jgi:hypothetical protein
MLYRRSQHDFEATVRKTQKGHPTILDRTLEAVCKENPPTSWVVQISENGKATAVIGPFNEERLANDYRLDLISLDLVGLEYTLTAPHNPD